MTGFDDLERQLRGKVAASAPRRRWPLGRTLVVIAAVLSSAGAVTATATGVIGGPGAEQRATSLLREVSKATADVPSCRIHRPDSSPALLSSLPASDSVRQAFPQLRRPPTARERAFGRRYAGMFGAKQVLSGGARELRATDGSRLLLIVTANGAKGLGPGPACVPIQRAELERRAADADPKIVAIARRRLNEQERTYRENLGREGIIKVQLRPDGRPAGAGAGYADDAVRRGTASITLTRVDGERRLVIDSLVPATVDHVIIRSRSHPELRSIRRSVPEQALHVVLPARYGNRFSIQWRAADGRLIRSTGLHW